MQLAINGKLAVTLMAVLLVGKLAAFAFTVSSGGSGGVFAPTLFLGVMLGGIFAKIFHQPQAAFAVVGMAAVFGSTARVPIATLLMVTEMTGSYHLLVPAALAVILGFVVQKIITTSFGFKYYSLYEAQVKNRNLSPAHRMEHLKRAVKILSERRTFDPKVIGELDLSSLLESSIPVEIGDDKVMFMINIFPENECIGKNINDAGICASQDECEIIALMRDEEMFIPDPDLVFLPEDQILIISGQAESQSIMQKFEHKSKKRQKVRK